MSRRIDSIKEINLETVTAEDLRWKYGTYTSKSKGKGRDKVTTSRSGIMTPNDIGAWGSGFVVALSQRWAAPERSYRGWHDAGDGFHLGAVQFVPVKEDLAVANMVAQHGIRTSGQAQPPIRYQALEQCLWLVVRRAAETGASVHMPRIGCGLAGGSWAEVEPIIRRCLTDSGVPVYVYDLPTNR